MKKNVTLLLWAQDGMEIPRAMHSGNPLENPCHPSLRWEEYHTPLGPTNISGRKVEGDREYSIKYYNGKICYMVCFVRQKCEREQNIVTLLKIFIIWKYQSNAFTFSYESRQHYMKLCKIAKENVQFWNCST